MESVNISPSSPHNPQEMGVGRGREVLEEYLQYFSKHLLPPYTYELPPQILKPGDANYYHYMCRSNAVQAVSGFMHMVAEDGDVLRITKEQRDEIKAMENSLVNLASGTLRTPEDMAFIKASVERMVAILREQEGKL